MQITYYQDEAGNVIATDAAGKMLCHCGDVATHLTGLSQPVCADCAQYSLYYSLETTEVVECDAPTRMASSTEA
jgi:hypothetical protein